MGGLLVLTAAAAMIQAAAQPSRPPLSTDRPNVSAGPGVVPQGYVQFELGWQFSQEEEGSFRARELQLPQTLIRYGLQRRLELQFAWSGWSWSEVRLDGAEADDNGAADGLAAFRFFLGDLKDGWLRAAIQAGLSLPIGAESLSSERADPSLQLQFDHALGSRLSVTYNLGVSWRSRLEADGDRDRLSSLDYALSPSLDLGRGLSVFAELFGSAALSDSGRGRSSIDTGFALNLNDRAILDAIVGWGLSEASQDWFLGSGITFRLPQ